MFPFFLFCYLPLLSLPWSFLPFRASLENVIVRAFHLSFLHHPFCPSLIFTHLLSLPIPICLCRWLILPSWLSSTSKMEVINSTQVLVRRGQSRRPVIVFTVMTTSEFCNKLCRWVVYTFASSHTSKSTTFSR